MVAATMSMLAGAAPAHAARCANANVRPAGGSLEALSGAVVCLLNQQRAHAGLAPLAVSRRLGVAGWRHARDMRDRGYFSHTSLDGRSFVDRISAARYLEGHESEAWALGEVLAWSAEPSAAPARLVAALMASDTHRAVILDARYTELGVGMVRGNPSGAGRGDTLVVDFGNLTSPPGLRAQPTAPEPSASGTAHHAKDKKAPKGKPDPSKPAPPASAPAPSSEPAPAASAPPEDPAGKHDDRDKGEKGDQGHGRGP